MSYEDLPQHRDKCIAYKLYQESTGSCDTSVLLGIVHVLSITNRIHQIAILTKLIMKKWYVKSPQQLPVCIQDYHLCQATAAFSQWKTALYVV